MPDTLNLPPVKGLSPLLSKPKRPKKVPIHKAQTGKPPVLKVKHMPGKGGHR